MKLMGQISDKQVKMVVIGSSNVVEQLSSGPRLELDHTLLNASMSRLVSNIAVHRTEVGQSHLALISFPM